MPYEIVHRHPQCPASKPFGVINQDTRALEGCSVTEDDAKKHLAALYANTADERADADPVAVVRGVVEERSASLAGVDWPNRIISVIAVPYEQPTPVEYREEIWQEVFSRSAFKGIDTRQRRIPASAKLTYPSFDHQDAKLVGKVVGADPTHPEGLLCDIKISKIPAGDETLQLAEDRALSPSVGFLARGGDHVLNRSSMTRRINRAFLDHLSFVPQPAYDGARIVAVRADSVAGMRELQPPNTPALDEILNDDVLKWANERLGN